MNMQTTMQDIVGLTKVAPLSRRGFMTASAASVAGFTLAAGPPRAHAIKTDITGLAITAGDYDLPVGLDPIRGGALSMPIYYARPRVDTPPIILVAQEIFGLQEYIKDVCRRLAKLGALAIAPDYYFRQVRAEALLQPEHGDLTKITDIATLLPIVDTKKDEELFADLDAVVAWAKRVSGGNTNRLGVVGFGRGGRTVWRYSTHNAGLKAGVAFYGSLADPPNEAMPINALASAKEVKEPVLGLYGAEDQDISVDQVKQMEASLKAAGKTAEFRIYPGAPHGFHADYRPSYRKEAAEDAWRQMALWFRKYGVLLS
jgi:carboxymethylenebutenolidase